MPVSGSCGERGVREAPEALGEALGRSVRERGKGGNININTWCTQQTARGQGRSAALHQAASAGHDAGVGFGEADCVAVTEKQREARPHTGQ